MWQNMDGQSASPSHPLQPLEWDGDVIRFKANRIVRCLLEAGPFNMNSLAMIPFSREDREQFAQLIGYSVSGFGELSYVSREAVAEADIAAERMLAAREEQQNETEHASDNGDSA